MSVSPKKVKISGKEYRRTRRAGLDTLTQHFLSQLAENEDKVPPFLTDVAKENARLRAQNKQLISAIRRSINYIYLCDYDDADMTLANVLAKYGIEE